MIWEAVVGALVWYGSAGSGCLARSVAAPTPIAQTVVPRSDGGYEALGKLSAAGWEVSSRKLQAGESLTKSEFSAIVGRLVDQAARREKTGPAIPMAERICLARLVAEFGGGAGVAGVRGLSPETVPLPKSSRAATFTPTPSGAGIAVVDEKTKKTTVLASEGYNYGPVWSDDGDEVAWIHYEGGRSEVWVGSLVIAGNEHLSASFLRDAWGRLTAVKDGFMLSLPGVPDRLVRIPALMEPEIAGPQTPAAGK
jgi:hypothetical protein